MSRRRKSALLIESSTQTSPKDRKAEDDTTKIKDAKTGWSEEEKRRLLDALKKDEGNKNWRWIARQVKTRTIAQVKEYASKLETEKKAPNKRVIAPKDDSALEGWINVTKRLRGDDNVDGTCIPQIMTIAAMEPTQAVSGTEAPDYGQIYTLLSRIMRGQPPPDLTPLDARVILDLLSDLERRLAGHDVSSQVNFVTNKYREVMGNQDTATSSTQTQLPARCVRAKASKNSSDPGSSSSKPRTPLLSLNPLNVPVQLLNLKKPAPVSSSQK